MPWGGLGSTTLTGPHDPQSSPCICGGLPFSVKLLGMAFMFAEKGRPRCHARSPWIVGHPPAAHVLGIFLHVVPS